MNGIEEIKQNFVDELNRGQVPALAELYDDEVPTFETISEGEREEGNHWYQNIVNLAFLDFLFEENFNEIIVHSATTVQVDRGETEGLERQATDLNLSDEDLQLAYEVLALKNNQPWNYSNPFASFSCRHKDLALRVSLVHKVLSPLNRSKLFIRNARHLAFTLTDFELNREQQSTILELVQRKENIIISGHSGGGKTSLISALLGGAIDVDEHIVVLEDTYEIKNIQPTMTHLLANSEISGRRLDDMLGLSLRIRPDRILLGEIRSSEIVPFFLAMNTGHRGLMSTIHADSADQALQRLALLFKIHSGIAGITLEVALKLVCQNIDYVIHVEHRRISQMIKVLGVDQMNTFYERVI